MSTEEFFNLIHLLIQFRIYYIILSSGSQLRATVLPKGHSAMPENVCLSQLERRESCCQKGMLQIRI